MIASDDTDPVRLTTAAYPMVDESEATGQVACTYARVLERFPMVPSLFKSLATCPTYLALAWEQVGAVLDDERLSEASGRLVDHADGAVLAPERPPVREVLARFVDPLARMLVVTAGLRLALDGVLDAPPAEADTAADPERPAPDLDVPATGGIDPALAGAIRRDLATPIVNSVWRLAADAGVLAEAWQHLGPQAATATFSERTRNLRGAATRLARSVSWEVVASPDAMEAHAVPDAAAGMRAILDAYLLTLPRVLTLVASSRTPVGT